MPSPSLPEQPGKPPKPITEAGKPPDPRPAARPPGPREPREPPNLREGRKKERQPLNPPHRYSTLRVHSATDTHYRSLFACSTVIYMDHSPKNEKSVIIYSCSWTFFHIYLFCKMQSFFSPSPHEVMMARIVKLQNNSVVMVVF